MLKKKLKSEYYLRVVAGLKILSSSLSMSFKASTAFCFARRKVLELTDAVLFFIFLWQKRAELN